MNNALTRHAKRRMRQRGVSSRRVITAVGKTGRYQGRGVYRSEVERHGITYVVVYKVVGGKKVVLSTWRK